MNNPRPLIVRLASIDPKTASRDQITELVLEARALLKTKGPEHLEQARAAGIATRQRRAADFYAGIVEKVRGIDPNGILSLGEIAAALNQDGSTTSTGKPWTAGTIHSVLVRSGERPKSS